jgi:hypothetical protein
MMFKRSRPSDAVRWDNQTPTGPAAGAAPWWRTEPAAATGPAAPATGSHSAAHGAAAHTPSGGAGAKASGRAGRRAGAREGNDATAHPQPAAAGPSMTKPTGSASHAGPHADTPVLVGEDAGVGAEGGGADGADGAAGDGGRGWDGYLRSATAWGTTVISPPDIWSDDRPGLERVWAYATRGEWTTPGGVPRLLGRLYALGVAVPVTGVLYALAWLIERPARLIAVLVLLALTGLPPF